MAKKSTRKPTPESAPADKTTTYSTRLNDEQREIVERASQHLGVSASRFIRDATLRTAADVDNGVPPNDRAIVHLAKRLADTLVNQKVHVGHKGEYNQTQETTYSARNGTITLDKIESPVPEGDLTPSSVKVDTLSTSEINQLGEIVRLCPITFSRALVAALSGAADPAPVFTAKADPERILSD